MADIALDVHTHLIPPNPALDTFDGVTWDAATETLVVDGHRVGIKALFRPASLLDWMDRNRIRHAFVSTPPPTYRPHLPETEAARWFEALEAGLSAAVSAAAGRLSLLRHLPVEHPGLAARLVATAPSGLAGFSMASNPAAGRGLCDAAYLPLWQALDAAGAFVLIHPGESEDPRLDPFYLSNLVGNPIETGLAAAHLVMGGVPERFPGLRLCLAHAGGVTPMLAARLQRGFETSRPGLDMTLPPPDRMLRRLFVDGMAHSPAGLALADAVHGADHVLFGSDWPFPMGLPEPHAQLAALEPARRAALFAATLPTDPVADR